MTNKPALTGFLAGVIGAGLVVGGAALLKPTAPYTEGTTDVVDEFGTNVREYLLANPDVIIEALQKQQQQAQQAQLDEAKQVIKAESAAIFTNPASPVLGNPAGNVSLVEFFDYNCGYCRHSAPVVDKIKTEDGNIRVIHKHLPILGPESLEATKVALAARMQDPALYEKINTAFLSAEGKLTNSEIEKTAREAGANWEKILVDKESDDIKNEIKANYELAQKLKLSGTPGFIVGEQFLPGAQGAAELKAAITAARGAQPATAEATPPAPATAGSPEAAPAEPAAPAAAETPAAAPSEEHHAE